MTLRYATKEDEVFFHNLANDPFVRKNSFKTESIKYSDHKVWFRNKLGSTSSCLFVASINTIPVGQVRFDLDVTSAIWMIDYSLIASFRGKGLGFSMLNEAIIRMSNKLDQNRGFGAEVKIENVPSLKIFRKLNFEVIDQDSDRLFLELVL